MQLRRMLGTGLPNVWLRGGVEEHAHGDLVAVSYAHLDDLYHRISLALALKPTAMTGPELRFLRKRLGRSQEELGRLFDKSGQAVAKWEKSLGAVPKAESAVVRLAWLARFAPKHGAKALRRIMEAGQSDDHADYVFVHDGLAWKQDQEAGAVWANRRSAADTASAIAQAMRRPGFSSEVLETSNGLSQHIDLSEHQTIRSAKRATT